MRQGCRGTDRCGQSTSVFGLIALTALAGLSFPLAAQAQTDTERFNRVIERIERERREALAETVPLTQRSLLDYGGFLSFNFFAIDDSQQETHILRQTNFNAYARLNIDDVHDFFLRARTTYNDWNSGDDFDGNGDDWVEPTLDRATYTFDLRRYREAYEGEPIDDHLKVKAGRQLVHWGNGLALSWEIDGGVVSFGTPELSVDLMAGVSRESVTDIDSSRPGFDDDTERTFYGAKATLTVLPKHQPFVYLFKQNDHNDDVLTQGATTTRFQYDSFYFGVGSQGGFGNQLLYGVEMVYEGGNNLSNSFNNSTFAPITQTTEDIDAWAVNGRLDYLLLDPAQTRFTAELLVASGDDDRLATDTTFAGNQSGTDDDAFNGFGLLNTGLAFSPAASNLFMLRGGASSYPFQSVEGLERLQLGLDAFLFWKFDRDAPIDEATVAGEKFLGAEFDFFANWQLTSDLSLSARYGVFLPGEAIAADDDARHFFFTGLTFAF